MFITRPLLAARPPLLRPRAPPSFVQIASFAQRPAGARIASATSGLGRRWESGTSSSLVKEQESGHISTGPNEAVLFFENLYPLKLNYLLRRPWQGDKEISEVFRGLESSSGLTDSISHVKKATTDLPIKVTEILPRLKDGGAFVKFTYPTETSLQGVEDKLSEALTKSPIKPWFNPFARVKARLVLGVPWLEDLYRFPTSRVKVEFISPSAGESCVELGQEDLYSLFRRYGKIAEITSQPFDSKVQPRYAYVDFGLLRDAVMARNCLHGFVMSEGQGGGKGGTKLRTSYERKLKAHSIWNWMTSHPRLVIPLLAAALAAISVVVFDPIRKFFVKTYVKHRTSVSQSRLFKWFKSRTENLFSRWKKEQKYSRFGSLWSQRRGLIEDLHSGMMEPTGTFVIVQGPRGSGKGDLVEIALKDRKNVLTIDLKPVVEARGESGTIRKLAASVGYRPVFSWANSISSMVDLAVQSTTGVKAGFSETLEAQLSKILHTTAAALKDVSLSGRTDKAESDDTFLETHPESRAVVVIENFLHKLDEAKGEHSVVYDKIAEWAAALVQNNVAQIIFLTNDSSYSKVLSKALPDRVFKQISLGDVPPDVAEKFILGRLDEDVERRKKTEGEDKKDGKTPPKPDLAELGSCIQTIGGRLTDLELFATRLKGGQRPRQAIDEIVNQAATEIVKNFLLEKDDSAERKYTPEQAWHLIKSLAASRDRTLGYQDVVLNPAFGAGGQPKMAIEALASAELVSVKARKGVPIAIKAGRPIYQAAFRVLSQDTVLKPEMDLAVLGLLAKKEADDIAAAEQELALLGSLPKQPGELASRVRYLLSNINESQEKILALEREMTGLKKVLTHRSADVKEKA